MSGFICRVSNNLVKEKVLNSLELLRYQDDDSTGIIFASPKGCRRYRVVGDIVALRKEIPDNIDGYVAMAHTRWSTYAKQIVENVYPISSEHHVVTVIVHGLIDNILTIKRRLERQGYKFETTSANEVVANLIDFYVQEGGAKLTKLQALNKAVNYLEGSYALTALFTGEGDRIYFAKKETAMVIVKTDDSFVITNDFNSVVHESRLYYYPQDGAIGYINKDDLFVFDRDLERITSQFTKATITEQELELGHYPHYMLKEIEESPRVVRRLINQYFDGNKYRFDNALIDRIMEADNIVFIAAGTSYNAALVGQRYLRSFNKKVDVFIASEWIYYPYQSGDNPLYILISQSGETSDVLKCMRIIRSYGGEILAITNTEVSTLFQSSDYRLLLHAGPEISVASTKAYIAQITLLSLLYARLLNKVTTIAALEKVINALNEMIERRDEIEKIAGMIKNSRDVFFLGRGFDYDLAIEAQLKLKETTYIHSEAYAGGEILHGPLALIDEKTPVIVFLSDNSTVSAMREVIVHIKDRGANVIIVSAEPFTLPEDNFGLITLVKSYHSPILFAVFGQYLAYYIAVGLGRNVDRPRGLNKSVQDANGK